MIRKTFRPTTALLAGVYRRITPAIVEGMLVGASCVGEEGRVLKEKLLHQEAKDNGGVRPAACGGESGEAGQLVSQSSSYFLTTEIIVALDTDINAYALLSRSCYVFAIALARAWGTMTKSLAPRRSPPSGAW